MALCRLARIVPMCVEGRQPPLQPCFKGDRGSEESSSGCTAYSCAEDGVRALVVCDGVGVEDEHRLASSS